MVSKGGVVKPVSFITVLVLAFVALGHLLRLIFQVEVVVDSRILPMWVSVIGVVVAGGLAVGVYREGRSGRS
jgi:uncharacterized membrane protein